MFKFLCAGLFFVQGFASAASGADAPRPVIVLKAARLFDGMSKALITNGVVIVQGTTILDAGSNLLIPNDAQVIAGTARQMGLEIVD